ncbi:MAG: methyltransferase domain-containing protein [Candidatus Omnitrophota bacterium]|nr:MAG: methyltransferase domain-containing protein [Candidatus Omnitrophota bacterium]
MCDKACIEFGAKNLEKQDIEGKSVIDVGALDVNGSLRSIVETLNPASYIGVDLQRGAGVDKICKAENLISEFGYDRFDLLISCELLEHVRNWRKVIHNIKCVLKPGGIILITTRSKGFGYHGAPFDFWRYEVSDMKDIFSDFDIETIEKDYLYPGVFIKARKPRIFVENNLKRHRLYSITLKRHSSIIEATCYDYMVRSRFFLKRTLPGLLKSFIKKFSKISTK